MRTVFSDIVERSRILTGHYASDPGERLGAFQLIKPPMRKHLMVIISDGSDWAECGLPLPAWEHVSVSLPDRCPTWEEMCWIKALFFMDEEVVIQLHPARKEHISYHHFCLHLWRPIGVDIPLPPTATVAPVD